MPTANTAAKRPTTIAIDAMGGDFAPGEIVKGAVLGARKHDVQVQLVGQPEAIERELALLRADMGANATSHVTIVPALDVIGMGDSPASAIRRKRDASIVVTAKQVKTGEADAMIAAGSTGAAMAAALLYIGRIPGVDRPAIGVVLPSTSTPSLLLDAGANADCIPEMLLQFGQMGNVFMQQVHGIAEPRVGIMNIGEELGKGNSLVNAAYELLSNDNNINFIGNVEGHDVFKGGCDVAVCDGFSGNIALKSAEGVAKMLLLAIKDELSSSLKAKAGALLARSALRRAKAQVDPAEYGGALLLGINGICVIGHGNSKAYAIENAIRVAKQSVITDVLGKITAVMTDNEATAKAATTEPATEPLPQAQ